MIVYGIKNCGTVKKAISWLKENRVSFEFHDYKKEGISIEKLQSWCSQLGPDQLINRKGTTWRRLDDRQKELVQEEAQAIEIMEANTSLIKRPLIEKEGKIITLGFDEAVYKEKLCGM